MDATEIITVSFADFFVVKKQNIMLPTTPRQIFNSLILPPKINITVEATTVNSIILKIKIPKFINLFSVFDKIFASLIKDFLCADFKTSSFKHTVDFM